MINRSALVVQMAKVFAGEAIMDQAPPGEDARQRAEEALSRVEIYLGVDIEEAKDILVRVLEDVS